METRRRNGGAEDPKDNSGADGPTKTEESKKQPPKKKENPRPTRGVWGGEKTKKARKKLASTAGKHDVAGK